MTTTTIHADTFRATIDGYTITLVRFDDNNRCAKPKGVKATFKGLGRAEVAFGNVQDAWSYDHAKTTLRADWDADQAV